MRIILSNQQVKWTMAALVTRHREEEGREVSP